MMPMASNYTPNQEAMRASLYQFLGGLAQICPEKEIITAIAAEELVRISRLNPDKDNSDFQVNMIKPILKSAVYTITVRYNNLLNDTKKTFGEDKTFWPQPVAEKLEQDRALIESLNNYINQL
jgi:hypothetical protein